MEMISLVLSVVNLVLVMGGLAIMAVFPLGLPRRNGRVK